MPSCKPCKNVNSIECDLDLNAPSNRPLLTTNMTLIENARSKEIRYVITSNYFICLFSFAA